MSPANTMSFADLDWNLPLFEDLFLNMQGQNVMLVDFDPTDGLTVRQMSG